MIKGTIGDSVNSPITDNLYTLSTLYPTTSNGLFGQLGDNPPIRVIRSTNQYTTAEHFWSILSRNASTSESIERGGTLVKFSDHSYAVYRPITSTPNSPCIEYKLTYEKRKKPHKIHFIKEE